MEAWVVLGCDVCVAGAHPVTQADQNLSEAAVVVARVELGGPNTTASTSAWSANPVRRIWFFRVGRVHHRRLPATSSGSDRPAQEGLVDGKCGWLWSLPVRKCSSLLAV